MDPDTEWERQSLGHIIRDQRIELLEGKESILPMCPEKLSEAAKDDLAGVGRVPVRKPRGGRSPAGGQDQRA